MNQTSPSFEQPENFSFFEKHERKIVFLFCLIAGIHVFIFSAAFPFFNVVDERQHFDVVEKYAHGHLPRGLEPESTETRQYFKTYGSWEFVWPPGYFAGGQYPVPKWKQSLEKKNVQGNSRADFWIKAVNSIKSWPNYESPEQPLYYTLAALWWHVGKGIGLTGGYFLYWIRFLNILFIPALVWIGYTATKIAAPEIHFLRLGVPALLAFFPQTVFYSVENDVLSPISFGLAFICLILFFRAENPRVKLGATTGLALAATFLTKMSNLPLLVVSAGVIAIKILQLIKMKKWRSSLPVFFTMALCAGLPAICWLAWSKYAFGDFLGSAEKIHYFNWSHKPFMEWWHHPIFTLNGLWTFISGLLVKFWQGEFWWHGQPLNLAVPDAFYVISSICFVALAAASFFSKTAAGPQRDSLWISFACLIMAVAFLVYLSISFNFENGDNPSREYPYFNAGRLILGALIPFLILYLQGINFLLRGIKNKWVRPGILMGMILFMLISEIVTDWPVFQSQYNWYHL